MSSLPLEKKNTLIVCKDEKVNWLVTPKIPFGFHALVDFFSGQKVIKRRNCIFWEKPPVSNCAQVFTALADVWSSRKLKKNEASAEPPLLIWISHNQQT
jgi:hypothetical protein